ncbi:MAG: hypothetical protein DHS20C08_02920 [Rhodomicrobium sp.]|nr:MAG: hypothetical protein DHS20C08_02920 [Rhodomicrobium sp.]
MQLGFGRLGLSSTAFWSLTPKELLAALEGATFLSPHNAAPPDRCIFEGMMKNFPDERTTAR